MIQSAGRKLLSVEKLDFQERILRMIFQTDRLSIAKPKGIQQ